MDMRKKAPVMLLCALLLSLLSAGCSGGKNADPLCGKWAYIHAPDAVVLTLESSGKAVFEGENCRWERCDTGIALRYDDGRTAVHRCVEEEDQLLFYISAVYAGVDTPSGLVGQWKSGNGWSYEFTEKGTFLEDGVLPGYYTVDEAAGTIRLVYNDPLEDTLLYYTLSGGQLLIDYPWTMVRAE